MKLRMRVWGYVDQVVTPSSKLELTAVYRMMPALQESASTEAATTAEDAAPRGMPSLPPGVKPRMRKKPAKPKRRLVVLHEDLINDAWWEEGGRGDGLLSG